MLAVDATSRVVDFVEKPASPRRYRPGNPGQAYVSMGNYLFSRRVLVESLLADARRDSVHDFGKSIIPDLFPRARVFAYDFQKNVVPGIKPYEEPGYWRDVGTLDAYFRAHMDMVGETPLFDLDNRRWPVLTGRYDGPPVRVVGGRLDNAHLGDGSLVRRATIRNSILGRGVWVNEGAVIEDSIIMDFTSVGKGAHIRRAIVDRFNIVGAGQEIGLDPEADRARYHVDSTGLVVLPRGGRREYLQDTG